MLRKIQKTGKSTYIVSLPKEWVLLNKLKEKEAIRINYNTNKIIIRIPSQEHAKLIEFKDLSLTKKEIIAAYIAGYDKILVKNITHLKHKDQVNNFIEKYLIGIEVINSRREILVNVIIDYDNLDINNTFMSLLENVEEVMKEIINNKEKAHKYDKRIDREVIFLKRIFMENINVPKISSLDEKRLANMYSIVSVVESIMDSFIDNINDRHISTYIKIYREIVKYYKEKNTHKLSKIADELRGKKYAINELNRLNRDLSEEFIDLMI